jgi:hypothetical protein
MCSQALGCSTFSSGIYLPTQLDIGFGQKHVRLKVTPTRSASLRGEAYWPAPMRKLSLIPNVRPRTINESCEKNLAEDKSFALLTQDNSAGVRRLAGSTQNHIPAWGPSTRNSALQANFGDPETRSEFRRKWSDGLVPVSRSQFGLLVGQTWLDIAHAIPAPFPSLEYAGERF